MAKNNKRTKKDNDIEKMALDITNQITKAIKQQSSAQAERVRLQREEKDSAKELINNLKEKATIENDSLNSQRESRDIANDIAQSQAEIAQFEDELAKRKGSSAQTDKDIAKTLQEHINKQQQKIKGLDKELDKAKELEGKKKKEEKDLKGVSKLMNALGSIPIVGPLLDADGALEKFKEGLAGGKNKTEAMGDAAKHMAEQFSIAFSITAVLEIGKALLAANKSIVGMNKELGISRESAHSFRKELAEASANADHLRVTTERLVKSNSQLNSMYQTSAQFNAETLTTMTRMGEANILSEEANSRMAASAARTGQTYEESLQNIEDIVNASNEVTGAQINLKGVMEATGKVQGQIRAQMGGSNEEISKAVIAAKALGYELEQVAAAGKQLLDFESSIEAELEAELLTGKQLNLERARLAALTGDYETLTQEISANVGDFTEFSQMNVLQQEAIAKAVGMTADELSNALLAEADRGALMDEAIANGDEQTIAMLEQMDLQEKFNEAINQLKELLVDIMTFMEPIVNAFSAIFDFLGSSVGKAILFGAAIGKMVAIMMNLRKIAIGKSIADIFSSFSKIPFGIGIPLAFGAVAGLVALMKSASKKGDDVVATGSGTSGYGDNTLITKNAGAIQLNNKDTIVAGTNLYANDIPPTAAKDIGTAAGSVRAPRTQPIVVKTENKLMADPIGWSGPHNKNGVKQMTSMFGGQMG